MKNKKMLAMMMAGALALSSMTACGKEAEKKSDADVDIVIGTANGSLCLAPLHIAIDNGYFEEEFAAAGVTWRVEEIDMGNIADLVASKK